MPETAVAPTTPTTETPAAPAAAPSLAEVKAARRSQAKPPAAKTAAEPAPGTETGDARPPAPKPLAVEAPPVVKPPETAKIDMDPKSLTEFTQLNKDVRETKAKLKAAEDKLAEFGKIEKARGLSKEGKEYDAIREAGFDVDKALAELLQQNGGQQPSAELVALKRELDELKARNANEDKAKIEQTKAEEAAAVKNDRAIAGKFVTENAAKYPHLAKAPEFVDGVFKDFTDARAKLQQESGAPMSGDEQAKLMIDSLAVHEEKWAKVLGTAPAAAANGAAGFDSSQRAGVTQPATKLPEKMTFAQVKAARRAAAKH